MPEKRTRRTRAELRDMMLAAGTDVLFKIEPSLGFEQLTYSAVFDHLQTEYGQRVTIGSVHERIWKSQRDFQLHVVHEALRAPLPMRPNAALERAAEVIVDSELSTLAGRRYALQSAIRLGSSQNTVQPFNKETDLAHTVRFRLWELGPNHPEAAGFTEAITDIRSASSQAYSDLVRAVMKLIGLRVRVQAGDPDRAVQTIALLGNATTVGLQTDVLEIAREPRDLPTGPDGALEEWYPDAIAVWAYVQSILEFDDDDLTDAERRL